MLAEERNDLAMENEEIIAQYQHGVRSRIRLLKEHATTLAQIDSSNLARNYFTNPVSAMGLRNKQSYFPSKLEPHREEYGEDGKTY